MARVRALRVRGVRAAAAVAAAAAMIFACGLPGAASADALSRAPSADRDCRPIRIEHGGRYQGCFISRDADTAAVVVATDEPVTLAGAEIRHAGDGVVSEVAGTQIRIFDSRLVALDPQSPRPVSQRAVTLDQPASFVAQHDLFLAGQGIHLNGYTKDPIAPLLIRFNRSVDVGRFGHPDHPNCCVQFVQFDNVVAPAEIAWNHTTNRAGRSSIEDNINMYESSGLDDGHPIDIHDNLIDGAYPPSGKGRDYTGGGIMLADSGGAYETARRNRVVSTTNYGIAIVGGHDNHIRHNWMISDGRADDGEAIGPDYGVGIAVWDASDTGDLADVDARNNRVGWERGTDLTRNDWWLPACDPADACTGNRSVHGDVTARTEARQRHAWARAVAAAGHTIGPRA